MAPLTWRNVDEPDLGRAARILEGAVANWDGAFTGAADTLTTVRDNQRRNRSAAAIPVLAGITSGSDVDAILARVTGMVDPRDMTPELQQAVLNARGTGLGYDQTRAATDSTRSATSRANETHTRGIAREDQLNALAPALTSAYQSSLWGDPYAPPPPDGGPPLNDRELLARTIEAEAGGEGFDGMLAAGSVMANRAAANGGDLRGAIMAPGQFSAWNGVTGYAGGEGGLDMNDMRPGDDAYAVADAILSGNYRDPTGGATHYYNPDVATPDWGAQAGGNWTRIGNHLFGTAEGGAPTAGVTVPDRRPIDIAGLIPENNQLGADFWFGMADRLYQNQDRAIDEGRGDLAYAEDRAASAEARRQEEEAARLREQGWTYARGLGPDGREEAQNTIMGLGLPEDQTRLLLEGVNASFDAAPAYYAPSEDIVTSPEARAALDQMEMNAGIADDKNPVAIAMESLGLTSADGLATDAAISGAGVSEEVKRNGVTNALDALMGRAEMLDLRDSAADVLGIVNSIAAEVQVDPRIVASLVEHSLTEGTWGGTVVDEDRLRSLVQPLADPAERRRLIETENGQARRREELDAAIAAQRDAQERIDVFGRRSGADAEAQVRRAEADFSAADDLIREIMGRDNAAYGIGYGAEEGEDAPVTADDLLDANAGDRRQMILDGQTVPTPDGRTVDPAASGFDQMVARMARDSEIAGTLESIRVGLATGGGAPANRFFGGIGDFFQPADVAQSNQTRRETMRQALDWFQSEEAQVLFWSNPALLDAARRDPVAFWQQVAAGEQPYAFNTG